MSAWMCLSAAYKEMHDFAGCLSGTCVGICTKTVFFFFFYGYATEQCVFMMFLLVNTMACLVLKLFPQTWANSSHFRFPAGLTAHFTTSLFSCSWSICWEHSFSCRSSSYFILNCLQRSAWAEPFFFFSLFHVLHWSFAAAEPQAGNGFWGAAADVDFFRRSYNPVSVCPALSHRLPILVLTFGAIWHPEID